MIPRSRHLSSAVVVASAAHLALAVLLAREIRLPESGGGGGGYSVVRVRLKPGGRSRIDTGSGAVQAAPPPPAVVEPPAAKPAPVPAPQPPRQARAVRDIAPVVKPTPVRAAPPQPVTRSASTAVESAVQESTGGAASADPGDAASAAADGDSGPAPGVGDAAGRPGVGSAAEAALSAAYLAEVRSWLDRHRTYPMAAKRQRLEGSAVLWFRVDRGGRVLAYRLANNSPHGILDRAVLQMIERANPLPPLPEEYPRDQPEFVIPIDFRLR